jgi:acyl-CoA thioester hydrolase
MRCSWLPEDLHQWLKSFRFRTEIQVRFSDTDMQGHINNVSYFSYFELGRLAYFQQLGLSDKLFSPSGGQSGAIVTASLECQYLRPIYFGQEVTLRVRVSRIGRSSLDFEYALECPRESIVAAAGRGAVVYINPATGKSQPLPEDVRKCILEFEQLESETPEVKS